MGVTQEDSECPGVSGILGQPNTNLVAQDPRRFQVKLIPRRHHAAAKQKNRRRLDRPVTEPSLEPVITSTNIHYGAGTKTQAIA